MSELLKDAAYQIVQAEAGYRGLAGAQHSNFMKTHYDAIVSRFDETEVMNGAELLVRWVQQESKGPAFLILEEFESAISDSQIAPQIPVQILDVLKAWSEFCRSGLQITLIGTNAVLDFIRSRFPKLVGGRFRVHDQYKLDLDEVEEYVRSKCEQTTNQPAARNLFEEDALDLIHIASQGLPRRIEIICSEAWKEPPLTGHPIDRQTIRRVLYRLGSGRLNDIMDEYTLTARQREVVRKLLKAGGSTEAPDSNLSASERQILKRLAEKDYTPRPELIENPGRGILRFSDPLLVRLFIWTQTP